MYSHGCEVQNQHQSFFKKQACPWIMCPFCKNYKPVKIIADFHQLTFIIEIECPKHPHGDKTQTNPWFSRFVPTPGFMCQAWFAAAQSVGQLPYQALIAIFKEGIGEKECQAWQYKIHDSFSYPKALGSVWYSTARMRCCTISRACTIQDEHVWVWIVVAIEIAWDIGKPSSGLVCASAVTQNIPAK